MTAGAPVPAGRAPTPINATALLALLLVIPAAPLAIVLGHVALRQIARSGDRGRSLALIALVLGYVFIGVVVVIVVLFAVMMGMLNMFERVLGWFGTIL